MSSNSSKSSLERFNVAYARIHGPIAFPLTIFGIVISIVTILILQRKNFRTPTNLILQHVAFFDGIVLVSFHIYSFYFYLIHQPNPFVGQSKFWPSFAIFHAYIGISAHSIALWLTCLLAIIRYIIISKPKQITVNSTHLTILVWIVAGATCLLGIPNYLSMSVTLQPAHAYFPDKYDENSTEKVYWFSPTAGGRLERVSFFILAIAFKIIPVLLLIIFSILLISNIHHARQLRERLRRYSAASKLKREVRTTTMLVLITLFTVLVELPQGLLLIAGVFSQKFYNLYFQLGDIWDITSIGSSFITFIMYCLMSQQFRVEMFELILPKIFTKSFRLSAQNVHLNNGIGLKHRETATQTGLMSPGGNPIPEDL